MSNVMNYSHEILYNVHSVLWNVKERGGLVPSKFIQAELDRLVGQYAAIVMNVALMTMGKPGNIEDPRFSLSEKQYAVLVERAKRDNGYLLSEIAQLRAEKGK